MKKRSKEGQPAPEVYRGHNVTKLRESSGLHNLPKHLVVDVWERNPGPQTSDVVKTNNETVASQEIPNDF